MKVLGISDEVTTCECCGRQNLKRTVVLGSEDGQRYYGTDCAAAALLGRKSSKNNRIITMHAQVMQLCKKWHAAGHAAEAIGAAIWNRFGYRYEARDGHLTIDSVGQPF